MFHWCGKATDLQTTHLSVCRPQGRRAFNARSFFYGTPGGDFPPSAVDSTSSSLKRRWRQIQDLIKHFWQRWMQKWLPMLHLRQKWRQEQRNIIVGDTVLLVANDTPRGKLPMARVTNVYPGKDGHVRVGQVKPNKVFFYGQ